MKVFLVAVVMCTCLVGAALADLAGQVESIVRQPSQSKARFSIHIVKADSGETVYSHDAHTGLIPASNMKIITAGAALKFLGADYEYKTWVGLRGDTLVVIGGGDPLLGDEVTDSGYGKERGWIFADIAQALRQNDVKVVRDIIVDSSVFDDQRVHPNWPRDQLNKWYACEVSGLNYNDNCIEMTARRVGSKVVVSIEPATDFIKIVNQVVPVRKGKRGVGAYRQPEKPNHLIVKGRCIKQEGPFDVAIERPAAFFGFLLAESLMKAGIKTEGQIIEKAVDNGDSIKVLRMYTHSMADCLTRSNKNSLGLAAEALLKTIAANSNPKKKGGSWAAGRKIVSDYLSALGIRDSEFYVDDASGLSRENKLSAGAITRVLLALYQSPDWKLFADSLAVGGVDGTIKRYFRDEKYKGKVLGKTGYIAGVKSFSGVCRTAGGDYIFSILANKTNGRTRGAINDMVEAIVDYYGARKGR
ncbi:MAG: D-alanyl-D-alanine carboxypeptidase/D-alanyl-D-alanine endopeptidase [Planctomycetota bacterium]